MLRYLAARLIGYVGVILFGVTFIFGSYSATATTRPSKRNASTNALRHAAQGP